MSNDNFVLNKTSVNEILSRAKKLSENFSSDELVKDDYNTSFMSASINTQDSDRDLLIGNILAFFHKTASSDFENIKNTLKDYDIELLAVMNRIYPIDNIQQVYAKINNILKKDAVCKAGDYDKYLTFVNIIALDFLTHVGFVLLSNYKDIQSLAVTDNNVVQNQIDSIVKVSQSSYIATCEGYVRKLYKENKENRLQELKKIIRQKNNEIGTDVQSCAISGYSMRRLIRNEGFNPSSSILKATVDVLRRAIANSSLGTIVKDVKVIENNSIGFLLHSQYNITSTLLHSSDELGSRLADSIIEFDPAIIETFRMPEPFSMIKYAVSNNPNEKRIFVADDNGMNVKHPHQSGSTCIGSLRYEDANISNLLDMLTRLNPNSTYRNITLLENDVSVAKYLLGLFLEKYPEIKTGHFRHLKPSYTIEGVGTLIRPLENLRG